MLKFKIFKNRIFSIALILTQVFEFFGSNKKVCLFYKWPNNEAVLNQSITGILHIYTNETLTGNCSQKDMNLAKRSHDQRE